MLYSSLPVPVTLAVAVDTARCCEQLLPEAKHAQTFERVTVLSIPQSPRRCRAELPRSPA